MENNEFKNNTNFENITEVSQTSNSNNSYNTTSYNISFKKSNKTKSNSKKVLLAFISGVLLTFFIGATLFYTLDVKDKLISSNKKTKATTSESIDNSTKTTVELVSLSEYSDTSVGVAAKVLPSIVGITVEYNVSSPIGIYNTSASAKGSGVIISKDGYILTNNHIINSSSSNSYYSVSEASKIEVYLYNDSTPYKAKIIGTDEQTDLAVIKIEKNDLTAAELGNSDNVKIGEFAMAIGNPLGMQSSVTAGIISAVGREVTSSDGTSYVLLQTDAAINSGNSGGALVNSKGEVIGLNTLKFAGTGIEGMGFAIPINDTKDIFEQLIQYNKVIRPYIGIIGMNLDKETAAYYNLTVGIYVKSVEDFSPAEKANIKPGDVIIKINNIDITTMDELNEEKNKHKVGDKIKLTVIRDGKEKNVKLTLGEQ